MQEHFSITYMFNVFGGSFQAIEQFCALPFRAKLHNRAGLSALWKQIAIDNCLISVFVYYPIFYIFQESISGSSGTSD